MDKKISNTIEMEEGTLDRQRELEKFEYTYSSARQAEIERIRKKYARQEAADPADDKLEQLRALDREAERKGLIPAVILGSIGCILLGLGMSATLALAGAWFVPGIILGVAGIAAMTVTVPFHRRLVERAREQIAPQVLALTEELSEK